MLIKVFVFGRKRAEAVKFFRYFHTFTVAHDHYSSLGEQQLSSIVFSFVPCLTPPVISLLIHRQPIVEYMFILKKVNAKAIFLKTIFYIHLIKRMKIFRGD
jgi:hypothetical protein